MGIATVNARQRLTAVCEHRNPDRLPHRLSGQAGCGPDAEAALRGEHGAGAPGRAGLRLVPSVGPGHQPERGLPAHLPGPELPSSESERTCPFGIRYQRSAYDWKFGADEALAGPLEKAETPGGGAETSLARSAVVRCGGPDPGVRGERGAGDRQRFLDGDLRQRLQDARLRQLPHEPGLEARI